ncbi:SURF1 family protein [Corynebacterium mendelii]|uniref:SURF1-like protein n=1 Tax=Corynebacterium mendelii TaxID=2765362 RepID=A0A939DYA5_9CORY|nr:SURF1 family protein [Corynebacterium mendelii]
MTANTDNNSSRGIRDFLTPGWMITALLIIGFSYVAFTVLAPWQLGKNEVRTARNDRIKQAVQVDPVPFSDVFDRTGTVPEDQEWTRVIVRGHYLPQDQVLLRLRLVAEAPSLQALTAFDTVDGPVILVNRGFVAAEDNQGSLPDIPDAPTGETTIEGFARKADGPSDKGVQTLQGAKQTLVINPTQIGEAVGTALGRDYIQLADKQPGTVNAIPLPRLESGPYLSYGIQWIAFGVLAPIGLIWAIRSEMRERRREKQEREQLAAHTTTGAPPNPGDGHSPTPADNRPVNRNDDTGSTAESAAPADRQQATAPRRRARYGNVKRKKQPRAWIPNDDGERF